MTQLSIEQFYPDVLGSISGGIRTNMDALQCALGIFPRRAFINQPVEAVLLLQNMIDQPLHVKITVHIPPLDSNGHVLVADTPEPAITLDMRAGEVGVLHIPVVAQPPSQPEAKVPVHVAIRYRAAKTGQMVRPRAGGMPPASIAASPFRIKALRDVVFGGELGKGSTETLTVHFELAARRLPPTQHHLRARYDTLWTTDEMPRERQRVEAKKKQAYAIAEDMTTSNLYWPVVYATESHFTARNLPLYPGEIKAVAKMLIYTLSEASLTETDYKIEDSRWFKVLCHLLADKPEVAELEIGELVTQHLYQPALYDAALLGFKMLETRVAENLGTRAERINYAETLISWFEGHTTADVNHIYFPLAMAGVAVNLMIGATIEHPAVMLEELREASLMRRRYAKGDSMLIFDMLEDLLKEAQRNTPNRDFTHP